MKKLSLILSVFLLLILLGCGAKESSPETVPTYGENSVCGEIAQQTNPMEVPPSSQQEETEAPAMQMVEKELAVTTLDTALFTLTIPVEWTSDCLYDIITLDDGAYNLIIYEKQGYEDWKIGNLFSILLSPGSQDYAVYPACEVLGTLKGPDYAFNVLVLYPTDVQFSEDTAEAYKRISEQIPTVLESFTAKESYSFNAGDVIVPLKEIVTPYYTLSVPDSWVNAYAIEIVERDNSAYNLVVYEAHSYQEFGGGKLFSLLLLPTDTDYSEYPSYDYLGTLESPDWEFNVVALYPTDVQFSENTAEVYNSMFDNVFTVLSTLEGRDGGCYFYPVG